MSEQLNLQAMKITLICEKFGSYLYRKTMLLSKKNTEKIEEKWKSKTDKQRKFWIKIAEAIIANRKIIIAKLQELDK